MAIPKKVKKSLDMYPVVGNQPQYPSGYDGASTPERRKQLTELITKDGTFLPKGVLHADLDRGMLDFIKHNFTMTIGKKTVPVLDQIMTIQRWGEFTKTWSLVDEEENVNPPFVLIVRKPEVQYGTNPALKYNIPDRRTFHYAKVPTWDGQRKGMDLYKIPQPVPVDITYEVRIICNRMRELNRFNKLFMQKFTSRQAYTFVKGHYIPIVLESIGDESQISDTEKRRFYNQNYTLQLQGFLMDEEEFEVTPAINRKILVSEVETKYKNTGKRYKTPNADPAKINFVAEFLSGTTIGSNLFQSYSETFEFNVDLIRVTPNSGDEGNVTSISDITIGGVSVCGPCTDYKQIIRVKTNDVVTWTIIQTDPALKAYINYEGTLL